MYNQNFPATGSTAPRMTFSDRTHPQGSCATGLAGVLRYLQVSKACPWIILIITTQLVMQGAISMLALVVLEDTVTNAKDNEPQGRMNEERYRDDKTKVNHTHMLSMMWV